MQVFMRLDFLSKDGRDRFPTIAGLGSPIRHGADES